MGDIELRKAIGANLKRLRREAGYKSGKAFAERLGITASKYSEYEQGRVAIPYDMGQEIAEALGCTMDELAGRSCKHTGAHVLASDEQELVNCYRACTPERQAMLLNLARDSALVSGEVAERAVPASSASA